MQVLVNGKTWNKKDIKELLERNDKAVKRALLLIYSFQTEDEKNIEQTREHNGVGFNGPDAKFLSSIAKQLIEKGFLTEKQIKCVRKRITNYSNQILRYMISNGGVEVK